MFKYTTQTVPRQLKTCSNFHQQSVKVSVIGYPPSGKPVPFGYVNPSHRKALEEVFKWRFEAVER
jgi:hypothetical protein